jgi:hypothetical protein
MASVCEQNLNPRMPFKSEWREYKELAVNNIQPCGSILFRPNKPLNRQ